MCGLKTLTREIQINDCLLYFDFRYALPRGDFIDNIVLSMNMTPVCICLCGLSFVCL